MKKWVIIVLAVSAAAALAAVLVSVIFGNPFDRGSGNEGREEVSAPEEPAAGQEGTIKTGYTIVSAIDVMCEPCGIAAEDDGSFLVTDTYNKVIWQVEGGESRVYAGKATVEDLYGEPVGGYNDAELENSFFRTPWAIAPFLGGYAVSDTDNNVVRLLRLDRTQTVNGHTKERLLVSELGVVFHHPTGLAVDEEGSLYVADTLKNAVRKIDIDGNVITYASDLSEPTGLCWAEGLLYVAETGANRIVSVEKDGSVNLVAGSGESGLADGAAADAMFSSPQGVAADADGTVYVADTVNGAVRRVRDGMVDTLLLRDVTDLEAYAPISPIGIALIEDQLYVCDNFARKVLAIPLDVR